MKAAIIGTTGYGGAELIRILHSHPLFTIKSVHTTRDEVPVWNEYPHLFNIMENKLEQINPEKIAKECDIVFFATPTGVSGRLVQEFVDKEIQMVDLSGDLRLRNTDDYQKWYQKEPVSAELVNSFVYGLSEWNKENIASSKRISNPGCYPTATLLGLAPVVKENMILPNSIIVDAKSGISGAGRSPSRANMFAEMSENFKIYKVNQHQHIPEIEQQLAEWNSEMKAITFSTHLLPTSRGLMATIYATLNKMVTNDYLHDLYMEMYKNSPFVRVRPLHTYPSIKEVTGSNYCDIGINVDERTGRLTIVSVIDNLMKGAAGQAIQNANVMNGYEETTGLQFLPLYP
ncbi:N-acetyl-gamma-glutamyl-phosphate reductase [Niallia sp. Sow4_A1]|jgi:N-acetyl-gamma-glutamyl-phosphate reductase|uniref:N-acetyl-gamma-glutamyl-phosphate reductase n=1 Tax=Niallia hominis TaxID=3133173 RepID=A0ABV1ETP6_9BACI|nr:MULTISPECIES: N-acetyl-gamma-glutamyl-phosphate reductase [Bacillaceae]MCF2648656.1 N-acetyl-gamma-glutamyl-phosphate reductase [Niallia circulans]MCM3362673.1 N-acetyl-gamma-glutamyl-phosphate reductase [Niallia sp. MER TA 168]CAI9386549.1 N-acetyl-gamma-glutamyl-phosphate reductase [Bacillus sp. T2.9-1]